MLYGAESSPSSFSKSLGRVHVLLISSRVHVLLISSRVKFESRTAWDSSLTLVQVHFSAHCGVLLLIYEQLYWLQSWIVGFQQVHF